MLTGKVTSECSPHHTQDDYIRFLKKLDKTSPRNKTLHIIADNLSSHKTKAVDDYTNAVPGRFVIHFIAAHSSWLNMVERWFAEITNKRIRRESWKSVEQLKSGIQDYIKTWNKSWRTFLWTKPAQEILAKIEKAKSAIC